MTSTKTTMDATIAVEHADLEEADRTYTTTEKEKNAPRSSEEGCRPTPWSAGSDRAAIAGFPAANS